MPLKPQSSKLLLGVAALAIALTSGSAMAGAPDRTATALWGPSSMVWLTEPPVNAKSTADITPDAAPRAAVHGQNISGPEGHKTKWCAKNQRGHKDMHAAHEQSMSANAPLQARLETLRHEVKAIWTAKAFDRAAFLNKRAEIRDLHNQIMLNKDNAAANAAAQMTAEQRAQTSPCWFEKHHAWHSKKMQRRHHGVAKKHRAAVHTAKPQLAVPAGTVEPAKTDAAAPEEKK